MDIWTVMNWVAWGLSALLALWIIVDVIKVEREIAKQKIIDK